MPGTFLVCECVCECVYYYYPWFLNEKKKKTGAWRSMVTYQQGDILIITRTEIQRQAVCSQAH